MTKKKIKIKGIKLHEGQKRIQKEIFANNVMHNVINCSRQFGKTVLFQELMRYYALNKKNSKVGYISPTYSLGRDQFTELKKSLENTGLIASANKTNLEILLINGSSIVFLSAEKIKNKRGKNFNYLFIDELSFMDGDAVAEVVRPMLAVAGRKAFYTSTPFGHNKFYEFAMLGQSPDHKDWAYYHGKYHENPYYNHKEVQSAKRTMIEKVFRQEYLAEFIEGGGVVFENVDDCAIWPIKWGIVEPGVAYYAGIDLAQINDYTVCVILNNKNEVVDMYRTQGVKYTDIAKELIAFLKKYSAQAYIETNVENTVYELIQEKYGAIFPIKTTNQSKKDYVEKLIPEFQDKTIKLPTKKLIDNIDILIQELKQFGYEYNIKTHTIKYSGKNKGTKKDDTIIALCLANLARVSLSNSLYYLSNKDTNEIEDGNISIEDVEYLMDE